jgi:hypothetical protein
MPYNQCNQFAPCGLDALHYVSAVRVGGDMCISGFR